MSWRTVALFAVVAATWLGATSSARAAPGSSQQTVSVTVTGGPIESPSPSSIATATPAQAGGNGGTRVLGSVITRHLPHTGRDIMRLLALAFGLVVAGALLIVGSRSLRKARPSP